MQFQLANQSLQWSDAYFVLLGAGNTIRMAVCAAALGTVFGVILGWLRTASLSIRLITTPFIDVLRSVPMVIQLILANSFLSMMGFPTSPFWFGTIALSAWMTAVTAEVARSAFLAVPDNYRKAARSLGMNYFQALLYVSAPLAYRVGLTSWIGLFLSLIKDSSLAGVIGYVEFTRNAQTLMTRTHETWLILFGIGFFYFIVCYPVSRYGRRLEKRSRYD